MRRRVWCETLPHGEVAALGPLLARERIDLLLAVRPAQLDGLDALVRELRDTGVFVGLWPMLDDADGRWASVASCAKFVAFTDEVVRRAPSADEIVIDLEPPVETMVKWKSSRPSYRRSGPGAFDLARDTYRDHIVRWRHDRRVTTAVLPMLVFGGQWVQKLVGTPSDLPVDRHSVMAYTSLFEGWSRGLLSRRRSETLLVACARFARKRFGERAALSLGVVGVGAFGDEPSYRDPAELGRDVALATAAGIDELSVFDLGGMVRRGPIEAWLEAFTSPHPVSSSVGIKNARK